jgi:hypothetical protein
MAGTVYFEKGCYAINSENYVDGLVDFNSGKPALWR